MQVDVLMHMVDAAATTLHEHREALNRLGKAADLGDHGSALQRGFDALQGERTHLLAMPMAHALEHAGEILETAIADGSAAFYGRLVRGMGQGAPMTVAGTADLVRMLAAGLDAVRAGASRDAHEAAAHEILVPVLAVLQNAQAGDARLYDAIGSVRAVADRAAEVHPSDKPEGGFDPLAASCRLLVLAVCDAAERALRNGSGSITGGPQSV